MARVSPMMIAPPLIFMGLAVLFYVGMFRDNPDGLPSTRVGNPAPAITEVPLPGYAPITPDMLRAGEVTIVNFWASWCPPCRLEHPQLLQMNADGLRVVGVNFKDEAADATAYLDAEENPFLAISHDPPGRTAIDWGVTAPPETFIVDGDGIVLFRYAGPLVGADYENRFLPALNTALGR